MCNGTSKCAAHTTDSSHPPCRGSPSSPYLFLPVLGPTCGTECPSPSFPSSSLRYAFTEVVRMYSSNKFSFCMNPQQIPVHVAPYFISVVKDYLGDHHLTKIYAVFCAVLMYVCIYSRYDRRAILADLCTPQTSPVAVLELLCVHFMVFLHLRYLCVCVWWSARTSVNQCISSVLQVVHSVRKMFCVACSTEVHYDCGVVLL